VNIPSSKIIARQPANNQNALKADLKKRTSSSSGSLYQGAPGGAALAEAYMRPGNQKSFVLHSLP
jgi:hypothetical protein